MHSLSIVEELLTGKAKFGLRRNIPTNVCFCKIIREWSEIKRGTWHLPRRIRITSGFKETYYIVPIT